jgi:hypothetical protein
MRFLKVLLLVFLLSTGKVFAAEPIKVAVIPSILNMFLQYATVQGILKDDPQLFLEVIQQINATIQAQPGVALSSQELGSDQEAASKFMLQVPYPADREKYDADVIVLIGYSDDGKSVEVFLVGVESGRGLSGFIDIKKVNNVNLAVLIADKLEQGLKRADKLLGVSADQLVDPYGSIVQFALPSISGEDVLVNVAYDAAHENVEQVEFLLREQPKDGEYVFELPTKGEHKIVAKYVCKNFEIQNVTIDVDYKPGIDEMDTEKTFSVVSRLGHDLEFHFVWQAGQIVHVSVKPFINPYHPHLLENF